MARALALHAHERARVGNEGQKGTTVTASEEQPRYLVESEKSGKRAAHRPESLTKRG